MVSSLSKRAEFRYYTRKMEHPHVCGDNSMRERL